MAWIPYEKYVLCSTMTIADIKAKFETASQNPFKPSCNYNQVFFENSKNTDVFKGTFVDKCFKIEADVPANLGGYQNSFRPEARVKLTLTSDGTLCEIKLRLNSGVVLFLIFAVVLILIGSLIILLTDLNKGVIGNNLLIPTGFLLVLYVLATASFNSELLKLKEFLDGFLEV